MTYVPSLKDISDVGYIPNMNDLSVEVKSSTNKEPSRLIQPQEEFSNPIQFPGFENLSQEEKLKRIAFSQFDPANQTPTGTVVPGGAYESEPTRMAYSILPTLLAPEFGAGSSLLRRYAVNPLLNVASRVGAGTAGNIGYALSEIQNKEQLKDVAGQSLAGNALLEGAMAPFRVPSYFAEIFNPIKYAAQKAGQIKNEFSATKAMTDQMYKPINEKYNSFNVTVTPKKYLASSGVKKSELYPDAKIAYDNFLNEPTFQNLHNLQSKIGEDWARIASHPSTYGKAQLFSNMREKLKDKVHNFLSRDPEALKQYDLATEYAKNVYFPYLATPTLRNISKGSLNVEPEKLAKSIGLGTKKTIGKEQRLVIPESHALRNHLKDLEHINNFGKLAKGAVPTTLGAIGGELLHPGLGGIAAGTGTGLGTAAGLFSPLGNPFIKNTIQNPMLENIFNRTSPIVYGAGRAGIESYNQNQ